MLQVFGRAVGCVLALASWWVGSATAELSQRLGRAPTPSELATELDLEREEVVEALIAGSGYNTLSMDSGGGGGDEEDQGHRARPAQSDRRRAD